MPPPERASRRIRRRFEGATADHKAGRLSTAIAGYRYVLGKAPDHQGAWNNLGAALKAMGRADDAVACFEEGLKRHSNSIELRVNFGNLLRELGEPAAAVENYDKALAGAPDLAETRYAMGVCLRDLGRHEGAEECFSVAAEALPHDPRPLTGQALLAFDAGDIPTALDFVTRAIERQQDDADAWNLKGVILKETARYEDSLEAYGCALDADPNHAEAHYNRGVIRLLQGDMPDAWADYDWRWRGESRQLPGAHLGLPLWDGTPLNGCRILLVAEQGFGDTIQFIRYAPLVQSRGGEVHLHCRRELISLLETAPGVDVISTIGGPIQDCDYYLPLLNLPGLFSTDTASIPFPEGYLSSSHSPQYHLDAPMGQFNVGVVWAGSETHKNDRNRSLPAALISALTNIPGVFLYSLQLGQTAPAGMNDLALNIRDFNDSAAYLGKLDLLITVDTAAAHLAGALGRPAWVMLPHVPDWRWMLHRRDTPWYQSLRLFRQSRAGDWRTVISDIRRELETLMPC